MAGYAPAHVYAYCRFAVVNAIRCHHVADKFLQPSLFTVTRFRETILLEALHYRILIFWPMWSRWPPPFAYRLLLFCLDTPPRFVEPSRLGPVAVDLSPQVEGLNCLLN